MDGPHDLGGKEGFGPVEVDEPEVPFHHDWEGRMWGIARSTGAPGWTIDWWRHMRELIDPVSYLSRPYFDSWAQTQIAGFVDSGTFTFEEAVTGRSAAASGDEPQVLSREDAVAADRRSAHRFDRELGTAPAYQAGDAVRARRLGRTGHTRLPNYVHGCVGIIHAYHGAHVLPDASAGGEELAEHLYSVAFRAEALWPEAAGRNDRVFLDLWESYLEPG